MGVLASVGCTPTTPSPERQCEHVLDLLRKELASTTSPDTIVPNTQEMDELRRNCTEQQKQRRAESEPEFYREHARCVMTAESLTELMKCEPGTDAD